MKNILVIRNDIEIDINRLGKICIQAGQKIEHHKKDASKIEIREAMFLKELHLLEEDYINQGLFFEWIEESNTLLGILLLQKEYETTPKILESFKYYEPDIETNNID